MAYCQTCLRRVNKTSIRRNEKISIAILVFASFVLANLAHGQNCEKLKDGKSKLSSRNVMEVLNIYS